MSEEKKEGREESERMGRETKLDECADGEEDGDKKTGISLVFEREREMERTRRKRMERGERERGREG